MGNTNKIQIPIHVDQSSSRTNYRYKCSFEIDALYSQKETIGNLTSKICDHLEIQYYPIKFAIEIIHKDSFLGKCRNINPRDKDYYEVLNESITNYNRDDIHQKGLSVGIKVKYRHKVLSADITCKHIISNKQDSSDPLQCPIYYAMKQKYKFSQKHLKHMNEFTHFKDEYIEKPECKYNDGCKAYIRLESGNNALTDLCHVKLYKHPPRNRIIKLSENINSMVINTINEKIHKMDKPCKPQKNDGKFGWNNADGYLNMLLSEVISNDYKYDLCVSCTKADDCKHDNYSLLNIVEDKMQSNRHKSVESPLNKGEMLSLVLYTGCDCNYDLCSSQRNGDYEKWKWFDKCLWNAIYKLSEHETGRFSVFTGLNKVKLDKKVVNCGYFVTYVSTTWHKAVAKSFVRAEGMIIELDKSFKDKYAVHCCDVSWISKFPDECEILFARSVKWQFDAFQCIVLNESNGVQTVSLTLNKLYL